MHQSPPPSSLPLSKHAGRQYRKAKALAIQVLDHCTVCIEEQLFTQAFSLLANCVAAGTGKAEDAQLPPVQHLALAATLTVHPLLTTRTISKDKHVAADDALAYLQLVNNIAGPQNAVLDQVFLFGDADLASSRMGKREVKVLPSDIGGDDENKPGYMRSVFAQKESLWTNAEDFWAVVGWAFNCSVAHPGRWDRWKLWLAFMLDVLEDDLEIRLPGATRAYQASGSTAAVRESLKDCIFAKYLAPIGEGRSSKRRLMRAVLADGKKQALAEFGEVWKHETKSPKVKKDEPVAKRRKLDLENGQFGDYFDDESDRDSPGDSARGSRSTTAFSTSRRSRPQSTHSDGNSTDELHGPNTPTAAQTTTSIDDFGGLESLHLRKRLLALLSRFCALNPDAFLDTEDLFDLYTEFLRPLPLSIFASFVVPSQPWLGPHSQASLDQMLLRPLLTGSAPTYDENALTVSDFEEYYAGFAASKAGAVDNARVSILVESLLRLLWEQGALEGEGGNGRLRKVVDKGITERKERSGWDGRRKAGSRARDEEEAMKVLQASAERMRLVLDMAVG